MESKTDESVVLYTDGASRGNPGPGGWAAIIVSGDTVTELAGAKKPATNNQMELEAVIRGLDFVKEKEGNVPVALHADSRYVLNGLERWLDTWVRNGWMTMAKKPVENKTQWQKLLVLRDHFGKNLKLVKVEGHSGHRYNDRCDELAVAAALAKKPKLFNGSVNAYATFLIENPPKSVVKKKSPISSNKGAAYSYVSLVDGKVHADKDWSTCEQRVKGKNAKYKKVFSKAEETELIQDYTLQSLL
jgi:ribonuclease HI